MQIKQTSTKITTVIRCKQKIKFLSGTTLLGVIVLHEIIYKLCVNKFYCLQIKILDL